MFIIKFITCVINHEIKGLVAAGAGKSFFVFENRKGRWLEE